MANTEPGPITALLAEMADGDGTASDRLLKLLCGEVEAAIAAIEKAIAQPSFADADAALGEKIHRLLRRLAK